MSSGRHHEFSPHLRLHLPNSSCGESGEASRDLRLPSPAATSARSCQEARPASARARLDLEPEPELSRPVRDASSLEKFDENGFGQESGKFGARNDVRRRRRRRRRRRWRRRCFSPRNATDKKVQLSFRTIGWNKLVCFLVSQAFVSKVRSLPWSMVDLLVLTSLDQLLFILEILFTSWYKTSNLNEEVSCTDSSPSVRVPCCMGRSP